MRYHKLSPGRTSIYVAILKPLSDSLVSCSACDSAFTTSQHLPCLLYADIDSIELFKQCTACSQTAVKEKLHNIAVFHLYCLMTVCMVKTKKINKP